MQFLKLFSTLLILLGTVPLFSSGEEVRKSPAQAASACSTSEASAKSDGFTPLYKGTLDDFRIYFRRQGYIKDVNKQDVYVAKKDHIHVRKGTNGVIVTKVPYSYYHVKVDYRWGEQKASMNAGLMTHVNLNSNRVKDNRPQSIEINMRHNCPGSFWMASKLGPFGTTFAAKDGKTYLPEEKGGVAHNISPFKNRTLYAMYPDGKMNSRPHGEWNTLEAVVRGAESVEIIYNGVVVNRVYNLKAPKPGTSEPGLPLVTGGIGLQSEGQEIFYRNFVIKKLEP